MIVLRPAAALKTAVSRNLLWKLTASFASAALVPTAVTKRKMSPSRRETKAISASQSRAALSARVENGLKVEGRTTYQLEYVRGRGLLPQSFGEIGCALAQFIEQPRVLDGDHCLIGEALHQV